VELVVGCPVAHRSWILHAWFDAIEVSCTAAGVEPTYAFVVDRDDPCIDILSRRAPQACVELVDRSKGTDARQWNPQRFTYMVEIRNRLLQTVRTLGAQGFLSVDSDILVHPELVSRLLDDLDQGYAAVGGKCFMTQTGRQFPSWARLGRSGSIQRTDSDGFFACDVIMAIKLMTPAAYHVDYEFDLQGEDIGWSKACARQGLRLAWDGRVTSKHVLAPHMLASPDVRVGW
jgi:hypothetical protein